MDQVINQKIFAAEGPGEGELVDFEDPIIHIGHFWILRQIWYIS